LDTGFIFDAQSTFDSYFMLTVQSQALARLDGAQGSASAETSFSLEMIGAAVVAAPAELNLNAVLHNSGLIGQGAYTPTDITLFRSFLGDDPVTGDPTYTYLTLNADQRYTLSLIATADASATLTPTQIPAPPSVLLLLTGIIGALAFRWKPAPRVAPHARQGIS